MSSFGFSKPLLKATLVRRYKRFLADVVLADGRELTVHCANSGSMKTCAEAGQPVWLSDSDNPKRKLRYTWEMIRIGRTWVGVHSAYSNAIVAHFIEQQAIAALTGYPTLRREVPYGADQRSRIDLLLSGHASAPECYVEVKHSTMRVGQHAAFPDAVTERGRKHLHDLAAVAREGKRAVIFFAVGRNDCSRFRPADEIDPAYGESLREVAAQGVEIIAQRFRFASSGIELSERLPVDL